jgi:hypothetical protein
MVSKPGFVQASLPGTGIATAVQASLDNRGEIRVPNLAEGTIP